MTNLFEALRQYVEAVSTKVSALKSEGELRLLQFPAQDAVIEVFDDKTHAPTSVRYDDIQIERRLLKDQHKEEVLRSGSFFEESIAAIENEYQHTKEQAAHLVAILGQNIADSVIGSQSESVSDTYLNNVVMTFIRDLDRAPINFRCKVWISGLKLADEKIEIPDGITIRHPTQSDYESQSFGMDLHHQESNLIIVEFDERSEDTNEVELEITALSDILRLYRVASIVIHERQLFPQSILRLGYASRPSIQPFSTIYWGSLGAEDGQVISAFSKILKPLLLSPKAVMQRSDNALGIAFHRYKQAILERGEVESRIALAISCLEALYLKANERSELSHRLSQRVAQLLHLAQFETHPVKAYMDVARAYEIRSTFVHGSPQTEGDHEKDNKLCAEIVDYARASLLIFAQAQEIQPKDELISKLDHSLLDETSRVRIQGIIGNILITK